MAQRNVYNVNASNLKLPHIKDFSVSSGNMLTERHLSCGTNKIFNIVTVMSRKKTNPPFT